MHLTSVLAGLLIVCLAYDLPSPAAAQFWKAAIPTPSWRTDALADRPSGICYRDLNVDTINPNSRRRQISYCCDGYLRIGSSEKLTCLPICREDCSNGLCVLPDTCECAPGYYRRDGKCHKE
ncbi:platelet endothelial aggregation receptor 1 [Drosophila kikkawai]|uniref:Platelet endothelial aggregation receptor 1 n=1 Tax=Drosophila kikkawai TaxID=30033 RepID=A0A6P4IKV1_DROKI|nr:platelet endothelial aggregation receptor 1 [Drosophila kikkawai]